MNWISADYGHAYRVFEGRRVRELSNELFVHYAWIVGFLMSQNILFLWKKTNICLFWWNILRFETIFVIHWPHSNPFSSFKMFRYVSEPQSKTRYSSRQCDIMHHIIRIVDFQPFWFSFFKKKKDKKPQNCGDKHDVRFLLRSLTHCRGWISLFGWCEQTVIDKMFMALSFAHRNK